MKPIVTAETIERKIYLIRGQKVILDGDLAVLYGVEAKGAESGSEAEYQTLPF